MKKTTLTATLVMLIHFVFAGGLLTNYNQSAQYVRMLSRNASLDVDGVFYNPAGLIKLRNGWHFSFSNQTIWQDRKIDSNFPLLNHNDYEGNTFVPVYPNFYGVYKADKWAFSFGVLPLGGGGTADFDDGLPSFEIPVAQAAIQLSGYGVSAYNVDMNLKGKSVFWGVQFGVTYAINDKFSVYGGLRWLPARNTYEGHIKDIRFKVGNNWAPGTTFSSNLTDKIVDTKQTGNGVIPLIGVNFSPNDDWIFTARYETKTSLKLDNEAAEGTYNIWDNKLDSDIPALFAFGVGYSGLDWLEVQFSYNVFFDKDIDWGYNVNDKVIWSGIDNTEIRERDIEGIDHELALGLQFNVSRSFAFSVGCLYSGTGIDDSWMSDLSFNNISTTFSGGIEWKISDRVTLDFGVLNTDYKKKKVTFKYPGAKAGYSSVYVDASGKAIENYSNTYHKETFTLAAGVSYSIFN